MRRLNRGAIALAVLVMGHTHDYEILTRIP
jgi:hypothetical protein